MQFLKVSIRKHRGIARQIWDRVAKVDYSKIHICLVLMWSSVNYHCLSTRRTQQRAGSALLNSNKILSRTVCRHSDGKCPQLTDPPQQALEKELSFKISLHSSIPTWSYIPTDLQDKLPNSDPLQWACESNQARPTNNITWFSSDTQTNYTFKL